MIIIIAINTIVNLIFLQFCEENKIILLHTCLIFHNPEDKRTPASTGEESWEDPEQLAWGLAIPEETRSGP